jgi:hypothetical protein
MSLDATAAEFLQAYAAGGEPADGWMYAKALQQSRLDFTPESLARLDHLLVQVRERAKPMRADLDTVKGRNFTSLLAFYVAELVRRQTGADLRWHDRESALKTLPAGIDVPDGPGARLLLNALDQGALFRPLSWVENQVLPGGLPLGAAAFVATMVEAIESDGPVVWWDAAEALGRMASWQMMMAADGGAVLPMLLTAKAPRTWVMLLTGVLPHEDVDEALRRGAKTIDENPDGAAWQAFSYDGVMAQDGEQLDAVMVIARTYGARPLMMKVAFPYRTPRDGRRFEILQPALREASVDNEQVGRMQRAIDRGIDSIKWAFGTTWNELREGAQASPAQATTPTAAAKPMPAASSPASDSSAASTSRSASPHQHGANASAEATPQGGAAPANKAGWRMW